MSEVEVQPAASPATKVKKGEKKVTKHAKPSHPPTSDMVNNAIKGLKERSGSSLQAIKKYIASNYKVDPEKLAPFIKKYLKSAVQSGSLVQTKGKGASGSFKLAASGATGQGKPKTPRPKKAAGDRKKKSVAAAKSASPDKPKSAVAAKAKKPSGDKKAKVAKSPSKVKKTAKSPTKKPKAPKPKTVRAVAASSKAKKVASPKKKK